MPELPEVETLSGQLQREFESRRIKSAKLRSKQYVKEAHKGPKNTLRKSLTPKRFSDLLAPSRIEEISRRGKYLIFTLDNEHSLVVHLGMSGRMVKFGSRRGDDKHTHFELEFTQGGRLRFFDARRLGEVFVAQTSELDDLLNIGLDAIEQPIPWQMLKGLMDEKQVPLKSILLDQRFIAGIGNIYADEVLFASQLRVDRPSNTLGPNEIRRLLRAVGEVLHDAAAARGTTLSDGGWRDLYDEEGAYQDKLLVHGREGLPCKRCRTPILRTRIGGRSTYFCPQCQSS